MPVNSSLNSLLPGFKKNAEKTNNAPNIMKTEKPGQAKKTGLSETAQAYLKNLQEKFGNVNFVVGDFSDKDTANYQGGAGKQYNCFISEDLIEQMAADESVAEKYEGIISDSMEKVDELKQTVEDKGLSGYVKGYGVKVNNDGSVDYIVMLKNGLQGINKKLNEELAAKKADNAGKTDKSQGPPKSLVAGTIGELLKRLEEIAAGKTNKGKKSDFFYIDNRNKDSFKAVNGRKDGFDHSRANHGHSPVTLNINKTYTVHDMNHILKQLKHNVSAKPNSNGINKFSKTGFNADKVNNSVNVSANENANANTNNGNVNKNANAYTNNGNGNVGKNNNGNKNSVDIKA